MTGLKPYQPRIADPYPDTWSDVADFRYEGALHLARARSAVRFGPDREAEYILAADYRVSFRVDGGGRRSLTVPSGMLTDLASVPRVARWYVGRVGPHLEAAIVHDFLFIAWQDLPGRGARRDDFGFANAVMLAGMEAAGVGRLRRQLVHAAVSSRIGWRVYRRPDPGVRYVRVPCPGPANLAEAAPAA